MGKVPHNFEDLSGRRFGKLTVIRKYDVHNGKTRWLCECDCGNTCTPATCNLKNGNSESCGCVKIDRISKLNLIHGEYSSKLHLKWKEMLVRCRADSKCSKNYYDRGIRVCDEWAKDYVVFRDWALANGYEDGLSLDRINNNLGYCPDNCRWIPLRNQLWNQRKNITYEYQGVTRCLGEWCYILGIDYTKTYKRLNYWNWDVERAFTTP